MDHSDELDVQLLVPCSCRSQCHYILGIGTTMSIRKKPVSQCRLTAAAASQSASAEVGVISETEQTVVWIVTATNIHKGQWASLSEIRTGL